MCVVLVTSLQINNTPNSTIVVMDTFDRNEYNKQKVERKSCFVNNGVEFVFVHLIVFERIKSELIENLREYVRILHKF